MVNNALAVKMGITTVLEDVTKNNSQTIIGSTTKNSNPLYALSRKVTVDVTLTRYLAKEDDGL